MLVQILSLYLVGCSEMWFSLTGHICHIRESCSNDKDTSSSGADFFVCPDDGQ